MDKRASTRASKRASTIGKLEGVVLGRRWSVWAGIWSVWIQIGIEPYWTPFGPYLGHLWTCFGPFLCFWTIAGLLLAGPYCCPIVALLLPHGSLLCIEFAKPRFLVGLIAAVPAYLLPESTGVLVSACGIE